jgi:hypothetical protein
VCAVHFTHLVTQCKLLLQINFMMAMMQAHSTGEIHGHQQKHQSLYGIPAVYPG